VVLQTRLAVAMVALAATALFTLWSISDE